MVFDGIYTKLERELHEKKNKMADSIEQADQYYDSGIWLLAASPEGRCRNLGFGNADTSSLVVCGVCNCCVSFMFDYSHNGV